MSDEHYAAIAADTLAMQARQAESERLRMVDGRPMAEVAVQIEALKRDGRLEEALERTYACMDAAERSNAVLGVPGAGRWYERAAIILRKLGDVEAEIRLIDEVRLRFPGGYDELSARLPRAHALLTKTTGRE